MDHPVHILNKEGVMATFSVAKRISEKDIQKFINSQKKKYKNISHEKMMKLLQEKVTNEIAESVVNNEIPGLVPDQELAKDAGLPNSITDNIPELHRFISVIFQKLYSNKKYDKMALCYFINCLVNMFQLEETDFIKFHELTDDPSDDDSDETFS